MDLNTMEALNEIRPSVYRVSMKLLSLQKICNLGGVNIRHITASFQSVGGANLQQEVMLNRQEVTVVLNRMYHSVSQEGAGHVTDEAPKETCDLMFDICCRSSPCVSAVCLYTALIALSADTLSNKYTALLSVVLGGTSSVSRCGLRSFLQDLSQVPAAVQEDGVFGSIEVAVRSCFDGVLTPTAGEEHVMAWLQSEPRLLLWLPTLYRLQVGQSLRHDVRCHSCKARPFIGLRYRCLKCVNVHLCQSCFMTDRQTGKHKAQHAVIELCTQPTWRETWSSLVQNARHALLPRLYNRREMDRRRALMRAEQQQIQSRAPPLSDFPAPSSPAREFSHDASVNRPSCLSACKALQTDEATPSQQEAALLTEVRNLQRDKWLLEQQMQAWRLTVQSDHSILEDRCAEMHVTMETIRENNMTLQSMLTQALNKMEAQQHANDTHAHAYVDTDTNEDEETAEEETSLQYTWSIYEPQTSTPTMHLHTPPTHLIFFEEDGTQSEELCPPMEEQDRAEEVEPQGEDSCVYVEAEEDHGRCSSEEQLQEAMDSLRAEMQTEGQRTRSGDRKGVELLEAADQVGESIRHLVDAVRANTEGM